MAQKPTPHTRDIGITYHVIWQCIEQDLIKIERVASMLNVTYIYSQNSWGRCSFVATVTI